MRKITLSLFALLVTIVAYCGAPQAINYQAVAYGPTGGPVKDKAISLRLSVLAGSSSGTVAYQEKQSATTDNNGTVTMQIGNGTVVTGTFSGIDWASGVYFLKTEIDTTGGTSYNTVGTVQFFSVPYALYAEKTNLSSSDFPDGFTNATPVRIDGTSSFVVPTGQTLYITQISSNNSSTCTTYGASVAGVTLVSGSAATTLGAGGVASTTAQTKSTTVYPIAINESQAVTGTTCGTSIIGFTVAKGYQWVLFDLSSGTYTVPAGKIFVLKNMLASGTSAWNECYTVNGMTTKYNEQTISFIDAGQSVTASGLSGSLMMSGYLKDK